MSPKFHFVQGAAGAAVLMPFLGWQDSVVFGLTVFFIDLDHIIPFVRDCKSLNVRRFFLYHAKAPHTPNFLALAVFHTVEFQLLLILLGFVWPVFQVMAAACLFHIFFDVVKTFQLGKPFLRAYSLIEYALRRKHKVTRLTA
ncbi:hypothetical protein JCM15519_34900 [Fundidesulfovibrio butyratiphilus]